MGSSHFSVSMRVDVAQQCLERQNGDHRFGDGRYIITLNYLGQGTHVCIVLGKTKTENKMIQTWANGMNGVVIGCAGCAQVNKDRTSCYTKLSIIACIPHEGIGNPS